jgi:osmotically-inducible protein OsmY
MMNSMTMYATTTPAPSTAEDHRVRTKVAHALQKTGRFAVNRVDIHASNGVVRLQGRVPSYYHKQVAQAAASTVLGDCRLVNEIVVDRS